MNARSAPHAQTSLLGSSLGDVRIRRSPWRGVLAESIESARGCRRTGPTKRWRQQQSEDRRQSGRRLHAALYHHGCERSMQGAPSRQSVYPPGPLCSSPLCFVTRNEGPRSDRAAIASRPDQMFRPDQRYFCHQPWTAVRHFTEPKDFLWRTQLPPLFPLEVLDRIRHIDGNRRSIPAAPSALIEQLPRRTDKRAPCPILDLAWLLPHKHEGGASGPFPPRTPSGSHARRGRSPRSDPPRHAARRRCRFSQQAGRLSALTGGAVPG